MAAVLAIISNHILTFIPPTARATAALSSPAWGFSHYMLFSFALLDGIKFLGAATTAWHLLIS